MRRERKSKPEYLPALSLTDALELGVRESVNSGNNVLSFGEIQEKGIEGSIRVHKLGGDLPSDIARGPLGLILELVIF